MYPAAWHPDPTGRHQFRYWDGTTWTEHVANNGVTSIDPLVAPAAPTQAQTPPFAGAEQPAATPVDATPADQQDAPEPEASDDDGTPGQPTEDAAATDESHIERPADEAVEPSDENGHAAATNDPSARVQPPEPAANAGEPVAGDEPTRIDIPPVRLVDPIGDDDATHTASTDTTSEPVDTGEPVDANATSIQQELQGLRQDVARLTELVASQIENTPFNPPPEPQATFAPPATTVAALGNARNTVATAGAVIGVLALLVAFVPIFGVLGVIAGIGAVIFGVVGRKRATETGQGRGAAITGIVTGALAALIGTVITALLITTLNSSTFMAEYREFSACVEETGDVDTCAEGYENSELFRLFR